jgi:hypothetical protein
MEDTQRLLCGELLKISLQLKSARLQRVGPR